MEKYILKAVLSDNLMNMLKQLITDNKSTDTLLNGVVAVLKGRARVRGQE